MTTPSLNDLSEKAAAGIAFTRAEAERVLACPDLVQVGLLGEAARRARWADQLTYARVRVLGEAPWPAEAGDCGEVRIGVSPTSVEQACERVTAARALAGGVTLTGFSAADLLLLVAGDHLALASAAHALHAAGLDGVAGLPIDELGDTDNVIEVVRALEHGGLGVWRATVTTAPVEARLDLIGRAAEVQQATGALRAFAPLPRLDPRETPATGYDDVRTVAVARLVCAGIPTIQADWPLYGPKLAQVALAFGANDLDGVAVDDLLNLGTRRSPREDIERQIRDVPGTPIERTGRLRAALMNPPVRLGAVSYLNVRPLVEGLNDRPDAVSLRFDVPSVCATLLATGEIDLGMVPSITHADRPDDRIVPSICIGSEGAVDSVALFTRRPIRQIRSVALDTSSRTSVALTRILCARRFEVSPAFRPAAPDLPSMLASADAALLIGDPALFADHGSLGVTKVDLGQAWSDMTGLPFVWAFWAGPAGAVDASVVQLLQDAAVRGAARTDAIADAYCAGDGPRAAIARRYLRTHLRYALDAPARAGLEAYYREAARLGLIAQAPALTFFNQ